MDSLVFISDSKVDCHYFSIISLSSEHVFEVCDLYEIVCVFTPNLNVIILGLNSAFRNKKIGLLPESRKHVPVVGIVDELPNWGGVVQLVEVTIHEG